MKDEKLAERARELKAQETEEWSKIVAASTPPKDWKYKPAKGLKIVRTAAS